MTELLFDMIAASVVVPTDELERAIRQYQAVKNGAVNGLDADPMIGLELTVNDKTCNGIITETVDCHDGTTKMVLRLSGAFQPTCYVVIEEGPDETVLNEAAIVHQCFYLPARVPPGHAIRFFGFAPVSIFV